MTQREPLALAMPGAVRDMHVRSSREPIRLPEEARVFPADFLLLPPPVVPDANRLRDDILYACGHNQRTVLTTAANAGLFRLFCAQHVVDEVFEHSAEWTAGTNVSQRQFLARWLLEYLPVIRVVPDRAALDALLDPDENARMRHLATVDPDDLPSATLALVLEAFYLSNDGPALRAVYGAHADLLDHTKWLEGLRAGGDAGELGRMLQLGINLAQLMSMGLVSGVKRLVAAVGPWILAPLSLLAVVAVTHAPKETKRRMKSLAGSALMGFSEAVAAYESVRSRFEELAPAVPSWDVLASNNGPDAALVRACFHTLARSPMSDLSAAELTKQLPLLAVAHGEAKVRHILRANDCFNQVWRGRWQVGEVAPVLVRYLDRRASVATQSDPA